MGKNDSQIFEALRSLDFGALRKLLEAGADANARDENGQSPLHHAARIGNEEVCKLLIDAGADVEAEFDFNGERPLAVAVFHGNEEACKLLIDAGADYHAKNSRGASAADTGRRERLRPLHDELLAYIASKEERELFEASSPATGGEKAARGL